MFRLLICLFALIATPLAAQMSVPDSRAEMQLGFVPVVEAAAPAVVNIYARRVIEAQASPFANDPFFREFFGNFGQMRPRVQNSLGSGVILSEDGIVVSNYHVVGGATDIRVVLNDRREYSARILLADRASDLAILKLEDAGDLPALELRDSNSVQVGELALAIGNPFGVGQTVSSGIISGLARSGMAVGTGRGLFLQTDAPINPGNSGGALVDMNGRLIGINTSILSRSGGSNGIGFAIPADMVAQFVAQAKAGLDRFQRPWAGIGGQPVTPELADALGLDGPFGVVITELHELSPFRRAGLAAGDVILSVAGQPVFTPEEVLYHLSVAGAGAELSVDVMMDGQFETLKVGLILPPDAPPRGPLVTGRDTVLPGMTLSNINPVVIAQYGLTQSAQGVIVDEPGRLAGRLGLRSGDVLLGINGKPVREAADAEAILTDPGRRLRIDVLRGGQRLSLRARL